MAWTLCTKEDVVALHPIPLADLKDEWSEMVEGLIRQHMGQDSLGTTIITVDEYHDGDGSYVLPLKKTPVLSVESLTIGETLVDSAAYVVFDSYIELKTTTFARGVLNIKVSYTSGTTTSDPVLRLCAASMIVSMINYRQRMGADSSLKWGQADQKQGEKSANMNVGLTSHLNTIMKRLLLRPRVFVR